MSNKRSKRNNNKVLKALRQKRAKGGRTKKFYGGVEGMAGLNIPSEAEIQARIRQQQGTNQETPAQKAAREAKAKADREAKAEADRLEAEKIAKQGKVSSDTQTTTTPTPTTTTSSVNDPKPLRSDYGSNLGGRRAITAKEAYERDLAAWEARQAANIDVTEGIGSGSPTDIATSTAQQEDTMSTTPDTGEPPQVSITPPEKFDIQEVEVEDVSLEGTKLGPAQQIKQQEQVGAATVAAAPTVTTTAPTATTAAMPTTVTPATMEAAKAEDLSATIAAQGRVSDEAIARAEGPTLTERAVAAERDTAQEQAALAEAQDFEISEGAYVDKVTGKVTEVAPTREAEAKQREAITGQPATTGQAAKIIDTVGYEAAKRRTVKGEAAKGAAASMIAEVGELPPDITAAIVEDPATVQAQIDNQPVEVRAAVAALPTEALVSSQMETLLAGMEDGKTPTWARPAVAAIEQKLAARGMSASTVGRDALFNAIIQSALPIAQSNAQALQQRAAQNLSNEQQANLTQSTQDMQRRMANLANRQTAESQTAANAQAMATLQSQFSQQAVMTTAQQQQQTRMQNLQNQQQAAVLNAQMQQATNAQNLGNEQQMELANLQIADATQRENMTAENQKRLAEMQVAADFLAKNAGFKQQMELANLSNDQ